MENAYRLAEIQIIVLFVYLHFLPAMQCSKVAEDFSAVLKSPFTWITMEI